MASKWIPLYQIELMKLKILEILEALLNPKPSGLILIPVRTNTPNCVNSQELRNKR